MGDHPFLTTYAAIRFSTGKRAPSITGKLLKAFGLLVYAAILIPVVALRFLAGVHITKQVPTPPITHKGAFQRSVDQLQEDMKK